MQAMNEHYPSRKPTFIMKEIMHAYMQNASHKYFHVKTKLDKNKTISTPYSCKRRPISSCKNAQLGFHKAVKMTGPS